MKCMLIVAFVLLGSVNSQFGGFPKPQRYKHDVFSSYSGNQVPILRQTQDVSPDGNYQYDYETGNGILVQEQGVVKNPNTDYASESVQGSYRYTAPDGTLFSVSYIADENGYQAVGAHLPTPPPIPDAILRSLEWIRTHPAPDDNKVQFKRNRI